MTIAFLLFPLITLITLIVFIILIIIITTFFRNFSSPYAFFFLIITMPNTKHILLLNTSYTFSFFMFISSF